MAVSSVLADLPHDVAPEISGAAKLMLQQQLAQEAAAAGHSVWAVLFALFVVAGVIHWIISFWRLDRDISLLWLLIRVKVLQWRYVRQRLTVPDLFESRCDEHPHKVCVVSADEGISLTFAQVDELANRVAHWAHESGFKRGHVVALLSTCRHRVDCVGDPQPHRSGVSHLPD